MSKRKAKDAGDVQSSFGFAIPMCVCGCEATAHQRKGGCQRCLDCRQFRESPIGTYAAEAAQAYRNHQQTTQEKWKGQTDGRQRSQSSKPAG